jgi:hypothetical protein
MARALAGTLRSRSLADGATALDVKIRSDLYTLGRTPDWSRQRAQRFLDSTLLPAAKLRQPWWELIPRLEDSGPAVVTAWQAFTEYVEWRRTKSTNGNTRNAVESPVVKHLLPFFAFVDAGQQIERPLAEVDEALVAKFISRKRSATSSRTLPTSSARRQTKSASALSASQAPRLRISTGLSLSCCDATGCRVGATSCLTLRRGGESVFRAGV